MSWRLTSPKTLVAHYPLNNHAQDVSGYGNHGTFTTEAYTEGPFGKSVGSFNGTTGKVALGNVYNGVKSVSFWVRAATTTEQFVELAAGIGVDVNAGTVGTTGWTSPTVYVEKALTSALVALAWRHIVVTSATGINANAANLGVVGAGFGACSLGMVRFYSCELTQDEILQINRDRR